MVFVLVEGTLSGLLQMDTQRESLRDTCSKEPSFNVAHGTRVGVIMGSRC